MGILSRFFGKCEDDDQPSRLLAQSQGDRQVALQLLFEGSLPIDSRAITASLHAYHPSMSRAQCELESELAAMGDLVALAGWEQHVVQIVGFNLPMPTGAVEKCVAPSHYSQELKGEARAHKSHALLYYAGSESSPFEQYVALTAVAGVLAGFGGIVVLNETAHTSFPAQAFIDEEVGDRMELLRALPLLYLYCGFVKYEMPPVLDPSLDDEAAQKLRRLGERMTEGEVWMRTHGARLFDLPDLAAWADGHHEGSKWFGIFDNMLRYMLDSDLKIEAGHTGQIDEETYMRFREPTSDEPHDSEEDELLVVELIDKNEINGRK